MWTQNDLIHALSRSKIENMPIRVIRVDNEHSEDLRIEGVEIINGEVCLVVDNVAD